MRLKSIGVEEIGIIEVKTSGDIDRSSRLRDIGGKGAFVREIEKGLLERRFDVAVHSLKDMPVSRPQGLIVAAYLTADDRRDALVSQNRWDIRTIPQGKRVGTGSPRRITELHMMRPDLDVLPIRGNVDTRVRKVLSGEFDAAILAFAGLKRLGLENHVSYIFSEEEMVPSPGQGVIAVEAREDDKKTLELLKLIDDPVQRTISEFEFGILLKLGATCRTPIGMVTRFSEERFETLVFLADEAGEKYIKQRLTVTCGDINNAVQKAAENIRETWKEKYGLLPDIS